jgi:hypothetical protein
MKKLVSFLTYKNEITGIKITPGKFKKSVAEHKVVPHTALINTPFCGTVTLILNYIAETPFTCLSINLHRNHMFGLFSFLPFCLSAF